MTNNKWPKPKSLVGKAFSKVDLFIYNMCYVWLPQLIVKFQFKILMRIWKRDDWGLRRWDHWWATLQVYLSKVYNLWDDYIGAPMVEYFEPEMHNYWLQRQIAIEKRENKNEV